MNKIVFNFLMVLMLLLSNPANSQFSWLFGPKKLQYDVEYTVTRKNGEIWINSYVDEMIDIVKIAVYERPSSGKCPKKNINWDKQKNYAAGWGKKIIGGDRQLIASYSDNNANSCFYYWVGIK